MTTDQGKENVMEITSGKKMSQKISENMSIDEKRQNKRARENM